MEPIINQQMPASRSNTWLWIVLVIIAAGLAGGGVYYWQNMNAKQQSQQAADQVRSEMQAKVSEAENKLTELNKPAITNWYDDFISKITQLDRANTYDSKCTQYINNQEIKNDCETGKITEDQIGEMYYFNNGVDNGPMLIALIPGSYMGTGFKLIKYSTKTGEIAIAKREDVDGGADSPWNKKSRPADWQKDEPFLWFATPSTITAINDNKILLSGVDGDAGCGQYNDFEYDIQTNYLRITKSCTKCDGEKDSCRVF